MWLDRDNSGCMGWFFIVAAGSMDWSPYPLCYHSIFTYLSAESQIELESPEEIKCLLDSAEFQGLADDKLCDPKRFFFSEDFDSFRDCKQSVAELNSRSEIDKPDARQSRKTRLIESRVRQCQLDPDLNGVSEALDRLDLLAETCRAER